MTQQTDQAGRILDAALALAGETSWETLHLHDIAAEMGISLNDIRIHYAQKDDLAEALFDRADRAALTAGSPPDFTGRIAAERLLTVIMAWLDALLPHRRLVREMLAYKLEPGHFHLQAQGITRISRTVQWFREAAQQQSEGLRRIAEEIVLTSTYLAGFAQWLIDDTKETRNTRTFLKKALDTQCRCVARCSATTTLGQRPATVNRQ